MSNEVEAAINDFHSAKEVGQWLRELVALAEDLCQTVHN